FARTRRNDPLERQLRAARPAARDDFVRTVIERIEGSPRPRARLAPRLVLAAALSTTMLAAFGALGGLGYAASAVATAAKSANPVRLALHRRPAVARRPAPTVARAARISRAPIALFKHEDDDADSPAKDQYKPGKG